MVHIRPANADEAAALSELSREAYGHYVDRMGKEPAPMTEDYASLVQAGGVWVAEHDGALVGLLVLTRRADHLLLDNVAVSPRARSMGIGARLLEFTEDHAREHGLPEIRLYTNEFMTENLAYYARRGYTETGRATDGGYRRVFFTKHL